MSLGHVYPKNRRIDQSRSKRMPRTLQVHVEFSAQGVKIFNMNKCEEVVAESVDGITPNPVIATMTSYNSDVILATVNSYAERNRYKKVSITSALI